MVFSKGKAGYSMETKIRRSQDISFHKISTVNVIWRFSADEQAKLADRCGRVKTIIHTRVLTHNAKLTSRA